MEKVMKIISVISYHISQTSTDSHPKRPGWKNTTAQPKAVVQFFKFYFIREQEG